MVTNSKSVKDLALQFTAKLAEKYGINQLAASQCATSWNTHDFEIEGVPFRLSGQHVGAGSWSKDISTYKIRVEINRHCFHGSDHASKRMVDVKKFDDASFAKLIDRIGNLVAYAKEKNIEHQNKKGKEKLDTETLIRQGNALIAAGAEEDISWARRHEYNLDPHQFDSQLGGIAVHMDRGSPKLTGTFSFKNVDSPEVIDKLKRIAAILAE